MKNYFLKLFNYDHFENKAIVKAIIEATEPKHGLTAVKGCQLLMSLYGRIGKLILLIS